MAQVIFMMGGPGAGKSTIRAKLFAGLPSLDCDVIKTTHADYNEKDPQALHSWSSVECETPVFYGSWSRCKFCI